MGDLRVFIDYHSQCDSASVHLLYNLTPCKMKLTVNTFNRHIFSSFGDGDLNTIN